MTADLLYPKAPFRAKGIVFPGLLLTTIISCLLLGLTLSSWYSDGFLYKVQNSRRATIQIIVQVLSSVLASLQLFALSTLVKNDTSLSIGRTPMTLDMLKFRNAIRLQSLDLDLRVRHTAFLLILLVAVQFPSALWAGALTPVSTNVEVTRQYQVPQYSHASVSYWDGSCSPGNGNCTSIGNQYPNITDEGTFTYRPWRGKPTLSFPVISTDTVASQISVACSSTRWPRRQVATHRLPSTPHRTTLHLLTTVGPMVWHHRLA